MDQNSVNRLICAVRQTNGMLQILDAEKENPSITLGQIQKRFSAQFGIDPSTKDFAFYNQDQFLTSLLAYLCMPSEKFYDELPELPLSTLVNGWGLQGVFFKGSLKVLVRHLRNSIAHGQVSVSPDLIFEFENRNSVVAFNHVNLHMLCRALAYWCLTKDVTLSKLDE